MGESEITIYIYIYLSKDPTQQNQHEEGIKGKIVQDKKIDRSPTPSNTGSSTSMQRDTDKGDHSIEILRGVIIPQRY